MYLEQKIDTTIDRTEQVYKRIFEYSEEVLQVEKSVTVKLRGKQI
ncbi:hypothetical protein VCR3J2_40075 [Vibrio coralliirubri]|nr:hypothetical protein VCR3J2_40075 [Vibrio coralliirubri]